MAVIGGKKLNRLKQKKFQIRERAGKVHFSQNFKCLFTFEKKSIKKKNCIVFRFIIV